MGIFGSVNKICDNLNDMYRKMNNKYIEKFMNEYLDRKLAIDLANVCIEKKYTPEELVPYVQRLMFEGLDKISSYRHILNYLKEGNSLSYVKEFVNDSPSCYPSNAIQYAPNQPVQIGLGPNGETLSRVMDPNVAGVSFKQAQDLNYKKRKDDQDRRHKRLSNEEEERHFAAMLEIKRNAHSISIQQSSIGSQIPQVETGSITEKLAPVDYAKKFVAEKHIVREKKRRDTDDVVLYMWDEEEHLYSKISQKKLMATLKSFWPENLVDSNAAIERLANTIRYKLAPVLDNSELHIADGNQTFFTNGYFDIKNGKFYPCDTSEWFHNFCIPYEYNEDAPEPVAFAQILQQLFDDDEKKINLAYQIIGALVSEVRSLKEIYVFQGVTNSGKTTLASIILKLLDKHERKKLNSVTEITDDALKKLSKSVRVVCIKDSGQEALRVNSVSYLKSYASGDFDEDEIYFKILFQTNNAIYSDKSGNIEKALHDRFLVLPFAKDMKTALGDTQVDPIQDFLDNHFEHEKCGIVKKALRALHEVMANRKRFVHRFPLNACVGGTVRGLPAEDKSVANAFSPVNDKNDILRNFIEDRFEVIDLAVFQAHPKEGISAQHLVTLVSEKFPNIFGNANSNSLGKILRQIHVSGKVIETSDFENKRYYNLRPKFDADRQTDR